MKDENKLDSNKKEVSTFPGYPLYPADEDIYSKGIKEGDLDPEDITKKKRPVDNVDSMNEKSFTDDMSGDDLDVPGSELDDQQEAIGSEDEENNYYSLGGDDHDDLDADNS
jgi:hypothetical protein